MTFVFLGALAAMAGAIPLGAIEADPVAALTPTQIRENRHVAAAATEYATYAILSDNVYRREHPLALPPGWSKVGEKLLPATGLALAGPATP